MHFGRLIKDLREHRGLTQQALADAAECSVPTIQRQERAATPVLRRSNITRIMLALNAAAPVSADQQREYFEAAGMAMLVAAVTPAVDQIRAFTGSIRPSTDSVIRARSDPDRWTAHMFLEGMMAERNAGDVLTALETIAALWSIDLPPRLSRDAAKQATGLMLISEREVDGWNIRTHSPVDPKPTKVPSGKVTSKRRAQ